MNAVEGIDLHGTMVTLNLIGRSREPGEVERFGNEWALALDSSVTLEEAQAAARELSRSLDKVTFIRAPNPSDIMELVRRARDVARHELTFEEAARRDDRMGPPVNAVALDAVRANPIQEGERRSEWLHRIAVASGLMQPSDAPRTMPEPPIA